MSPNMNPLGSQSNNLSLILQAILLGLQIAAQALPVIAQYKETFSQHPHEMEKNINAAMDAEHPVAKAIVASAIAAPTS